MSIKIGNNILAKSSTYHPDLFDIKWSDHIINNISWLRADTFSWHSGELYNRAYEHLLDDYNNGTSKTDEIEGITIWYRETQDGHKITTIINGESEYREEAIARLYEKTGIAWYYIIDIENKRFKLPRTKFAFEGVRTAVGNYIEPGLPQIDLTNKSPVTAQGASYEAKSNRVQISSNGTGSGASSSGYGGSAGIGYALDKSVIGSNVSEIIANNSIYGNSNTVQSPATEMYLYFYVGNYAQSDLENVAGEMSEVLNNKADIDLANILSNIDFVVESQFPTVENNYTWYRKYKSGWVEQGGVISGSSSGWVTVNLPITMINTNYTILTTAEERNTNNSLQVSAYYNKTTSSFQTANSCESFFDDEISWQVSGMAA